jgi:hypothetical protein
VSVFDLMAERMALDWLIFQQVWPLWVVLVVLLLVFGRR